MKRSLKRTGTLIVLLAVLVVFGWGVRKGYIYATEVPAGYQRLDFQRDIASEIHVDAAQRVEIDQALLELEGKPIFLKGYMYPTEKTDGNTEFFISWDIFYSCFRPRPTAADYINVKLAAHEAVPFQLGPLSVWGTLHVDRTPRGDREIISLVDAHCEPAGSAF